MVLLFQLLLPSFFKAKQTKLDSRKIFNSTTSKILYLIQEEIKQIHLRNKDYLLVPRKSHVVQIPHSKCRQYISNKQILFFHQGRKGEAYRHFSKNITNTDVADSVHVRIACAWVPQYGSWRALQHKGPSWDVLCHSGSCPANEHTGKPQTKAECVYVASFLPGSFLWVPSKTVQRPGLCSK